MKLNRKLGGVVAAAAIFGCAAATQLPPADGGPAIPARLAATFPSGWRFPAGGRATFAPNAMVASNSELASAAGVEILKQGGNAVDAAVATGFALAVTHPEAGNIGGGGYMVIRMADGRTGALDYREVAPLAATRDMYIDSSGKVSKASLVGPLASGVPGAVAGMAEALEKWGTFPLAKVLAPAIRLAESGFTVDSALHASLKSNDALIKRFAGASVFFPGGNAMPMGATLRQPKLAATLRLIARDGAGAFYKGPVADQIAGEMKAAGGIITRADLAAYRARWRVPLRTTYRGYTLITMPPSSSGGITIAETLNILEQRGRAAPFGSVTGIHLLASAYQRAFIDRNSRLGDPDFVRVPIGLLTDKTYAASLARTIGASSATPTRSLPAAGSEGTHTTHYSAVDRFGNAVATTTTLNDLYGSGVYIAEAGFFLNDEMDDFSAKPGSPNMFGLVQGEANAITPGKRMLSSMSPTIVLDPAGGLLLVVGGRGGSRIITSTSQVILNVIDHSMSLSDAVRAPRIHHQALPDSVRVEIGGFPDSVLSGLRVMGYALQPLRNVGASVNAIMRVRGGYEGTPDPRSVGAAVGY